MGIGIANARIVVDRTAADVKNLPELLTNPPLWKAPP